MPVESVALRRPRARGRRTYACLERSSRSPDQRASELVCGRRLIIKRFVESSGATLRATEKQCAFSGPDGGGKTASFGCAIGGDLAPSIQIRIVASTRSHSAHFLIASAPKEHLGARPH